MNAMKARTVLWTAACGVLAAAVVVSARSLALATPARDRIARKEGELLRLSRIDEEAAAVRNAVQAVESLGAERLGAPAALPDLPAALSKPDDVRTESRPFADGWMEVTATATFRDAPLRDAMTLADLAAAARPAWRLVSCDVRASPRGAGTGQVTLVLATVRRLTEAGEP